MPLSRPDLSMGLRPTGEVLDNATKRERELQRLVLLDNKSRAPASTAGVLAAGTFSYAKRLSVVAAALGITDLDNLSGHDRRRLIHAIFDPRVAPHAVERAP